MKVRELGQNPISPEKPAGDDAHYEPEFEELQQEIDKLSIASATGEGTDWKRVTNLCVAILSEKSKDLLVAVYLVTGLTKTHGFEGFTVGVGFLNDLVSNFWDTLYPPKRRMRGRLNAISWWEERMEAFIKSLPEDAPVAAEQMAAAKKSLGDLDATLAEKSDDAPSMRQLLTYLDMAPAEEEAQPEPEPEPEPQPEPEEFQSAPSAPQEQQQQATAQPAPQPAAPPKQSPAPSPPPPSSGRKASAHPAKSDKEAQEALRTGLDELLTVADFYLENDPTNPLSYRLRRMAAWLPLSGPPPASDGKTMLPPPEDAVKGPIENLLQNVNWESAIKASESRINEFRFWLDMTRFTATALENMGPAYADAAKAVAAETLLLVERMQGIENLAFSDGTPFADQNTRTWLNTLGLGAGSGSAAGGDPAKQDVAQALQDARALLQDKKAIAAAELMQQGLNKAGTARERLLWRNGTGRFLLQAAKPDLALSMVEQALADIEAFRVEEFAPDLAVETLRLGCDACEALANEESAAKGRELLMRLARISPAEAIKISGVS